ncbi:MAG: hypothetical protein LQ350_003306 [Teloschistes chrysophthalmus]|nr:MAG: hypothetical protein LQ350_003306 [Niorma chrysophthalma]
MDPSSPSPAPKVPAPSEQPTTLPPQLSHSTSDSILGTIKSAGTHKTGRKISSRSRRTRSAASSRANSLDGSEFGMEDYSIDLAQLGEKDSSWTLGKAGERDIERVSSRDDGPEDFTLRLGEWMRGTMPWKKESGSKEEGPREDEKDMAGHAEAPEEPEADDDCNDRNSGRKDRDHVAKSESFPMELSGPGVGFVQKPHRRPSGPSQLDTEAIQDRAAQEVFDQISALQMEVERLQLENRDHLSAQRSIEHKNLEQQKECRILRTQVDDLRSEANRLQDSEFKASQRALRLEQELKRDVSKVGSLRAKFEPLSQELDTVKLKAEADKQYADSTINALKADLRAAKDHAAKSQADLTMQLSTRAAELYAVKADMEATKTRFENREDILKEQLQAKDQAIAVIKEENAKAVTIVSPELEQAREQLSETRRIVQNVEDENDLLVQDNERQAEEITNLQHTLEEDRLRHLSSIDAQVADLQDEIARMQAQKTADTIPYSEHTAGLDELRQEHATATEALVAKHKKEMNLLRAAIIKAGEGMKKREQRIIASHVKETNFLNGRIASLESDFKGAESSKSKHSHDEDDETPKLQDLRTTILTLQQRLATTTAALAQATAQARQESQHRQQQIEKMKSYTELVRDEANKYVQRLKEECEGRIREVSEGVEGTVEERMEEREREWRRRIKVVLRDRERLARVLMEGWGREECGVPKEGEGGRQGYRYKYVGRDGKVLAG